MRKIIWIIVVILSFSCSQNQVEMESHSSMSLEEDMELSEEMGIVTNETTTKNYTDGRKIIWTSNVKYQVRNVDSSTNNIQQLVDEFSGFVASMKMSTTNYRVTNTFKIRVANDKFEKLINELKKGALYVDELSIESNDVTEEFVDIEIRLQTKKQVRERYIDILRNKAGTVKDVIHAENAIREITEEIEAKEGRLRYLKNQVSLSTVNLTIYQKVEFKEEPKIYEKPYFQKLVDGLKNGWSLITRLIIFLANIWPLFIVIVLVFWRRSWILSKFKK